MRNLVAVRPLIYANRRMQAGDYFTTRTNRDARILVAIGKAAAARVPGSVEAPSPAVLQKAKNAKNAGGADGDKEALNKLRAEYTDLLGKKPFAGWKPEELQRRIDEALAS